MFMTPYVRDWLTHAGEDIGLVAMILQEGGFLNSACFHAQQAAEKYLKAFLAFHEQEVRKIHHLGELLLACGKIDPDFNELQNEGLLLNPLYITTRYPADMPECTKEEVEQAHAAAFRIKEFVLSKLPG